MLKNCKNKDEKFENLDLKLQQWRNRILKTDLENQKKKKVSFRQLFHGQYIKITPIFWYNWFTSVFTYYGIVFMIPQTESKRVKDPSISSLYLPIVLEMPSYIVCILLMDLKFLGRKYSMILSYVFFVVFVILTISFSSHFLLLASISKFWISIAFMIVI